MVEEDPAGLDVLTTPAGLEGRPLGPVEAGQEYAIRHGETIQGPTDTDTDTGTGTGTGTDTGTATAAATATDTDTDTGRGWDVPHAVVPGIGHHHAHGWWLRPLSAGGNVGPGLGPAGGCGAGS